MALPITSALVRPLVAACLLVACGACAAPSDEDVPMGLVLLTREGCPATDEMQANLDAALAAMGLARDYEVVDLDTLPSADRRRGYPTPTLLYANRDVFGMPPPTPPLPEPT